ncbi:MAG: hypothetical protein ACLFQK_05655, partial [Fibrobacterota bacterium]
MEKRFIPNKDAYVNCNMYIPGRMIEKPYEYQTTEQYNSGAAQELRMDGCFIVPVMDFDLRSLLGKKIKSARLGVHWIHNPVEEWDVGTISHPWEEGTGKGYGSPVDGISFHNSAKDKTWPENYIFNFFTLGNGNSRHQVIKPIAAAPDRQELELDPQLIYSLIYRENYGLSFYDTRGDIFSHFRKPWNYYSPPKWLHSRQTKAAGKAPELAVEFEDADRPELSLSDLSLSSAPALEPGTSSLRVRWKNPVGGEFLRFDMKLNGRKVPRYMVPVFDGRKNEYEAVIPGLKPSGNYEVELAAQGPGGKTDKLSAAASTLSSVKPPPVRKKKVQKTSDCLVFKNSSLKVYAVDEMHKVDGVSGKPIKNGGSLYSKCVPTITSNNAIRLKAARNEVLGFQLIFKPSDDARISVVPYGEKLPPLKFFRHHYIEDGERLCPDALIPIEDASFDFKKTKGEKGLSYQGIFIDIPLQEEESGEYDFDLSLLVDGKPAGKVNVVVSVQDFLLEERGNFIFEMNNYTVPSSSFSRHRKKWSPGSAEDHDFDYKYYSICHDHRTEMDVLPYSQLGSVNLDIVPELEGEGAETRVSDWSRFDEYYAPLLEGHV